MKLASKVILLFQDPDGFGSSIATALHPKPESDVIREQSSFSIALDKYGVNGSQILGDVVHFLDPSGSPHVSILVLPNYAPPIASCAMNEILSLISSQNPSKPTIILPSIAKTIVTPGITLYGAEIGAKTEFSRDLIAKTSKPPSDLKIYGEPVACLVQMASVLNIATVLLFGSRGQGQSGKSNGFYIETICNMGDYLAAHINLDFRKEKLKEMAPGKARGAQEPWRELYGSLQRISYDDACSMHQFTPVNCSTVILLLNYYCNKTVVALLPLGLSALFCIASLSSTSSSVHHHLIILLIPNLQWHFFRYFRQPLLSGGFEFLQYSSIAFINETAKAFATGRENTSLM
ncbi:hypothetical protein FCM35_KLT13649 [Carex littledalei]|uniref:DUF7894 domain-containing protein n=1 Tax=Carex littledalei TaxID=544730 RepID=A0A833QN23_9POAL|nr:hypothetical protein FCM35_KLT13649 [Carex littledalei]